MCFRCQSCRNVVAQNIPQATIVVQERAKKYNSYFDGRFAIEGKLLESCSAQDLKTLRCKETQGKEIVKQIAVCPECELRMTGKCSYSPPAEESYISHLPEKAQVLAREVPVEYISIPRRDNKNS